ncbi:MAG TPA: hypothetical protein PK736_01525 [Bacteroidia bacterium]|nr:hypothetical protein [Bacteroidia bacterium]
MTKKLITKNILLGFLSWLIPYAISFLFFKPGGELMVPYATFKSTIMLVGVISGCYLLYRYFKFVDADFVTNAIIVGISWFAINIVLDILFLLPFTKTTYSDYFTTIGIGYFAIPTISITLGYFLDRKPY